MTQVPSIYYMTADAEEGERYGKSIHYSQEDLKADNRIDETTQQFLGEDCVFLNQFRKVVEARRCNVLELIVSKRPKGDATYSER